jgi:raffinose/stachyose/melibiose transport system permease protein
MTQIKTIQLDIASKAISRPRKPIITEAQITALIFIIPALAIFLTFAVWPIIQSARYSLYQWNGIGALTEYTGLKNYERLLQDPVFWKALSNNFTVVIWSLVTQIPLAMGLAILLTSKVKGSAFFRTLYFAPLVLSDVIVAALWNWVYNPTIGMANSLLKALHLPIQGWLGNENLALFCVLAATTWKYLGFYMVIYIAAIQAIPEELYEAAQIDGANGWRLHRHITIPLLIPTTRTSAVLIIVGSLKFFDILWALTEGGPGNASDVLATYMFKQAFRSQDWSYGSTVAFALFVIAFVVAMIFMFVTRRQQTELKAG